MTPLFTGATARRAVRSIAGLGIALVAVAGCSRDGDPTSPASQISDAKVGVTIDSASTDTKITLGAPETVATITRPQAIRSYSASLTLTRLQGGKIDLREAGFNLEIPKGAIPGDAPMTITVTAIAGDAYAYNFEPHGVVFAKPLIAKQAVPTAVASALNAQFAPRPDAAYFATPDQLDAAADQVTATELLPTSLVIAESKIKWDIPHFSGYVIASGRKSTAE